MGPAEELQGAVAGTLGPCALAGAHGPIQALTAAAFSVPGAKRHLHILSKQWVRPTCTHLPLRPCHRPASHGQRVAQLCTQVTTPLAS